jgi:ribose transport system ATP-binding protein
MSQYILEMKGINKSFSSVPVLKNVDFALEKGEIHALVGSNGAGKSTLMKILTGVYTADEGKILIDGKEITVSNPNDAKANGIAMIFQELSLIQTMTVSENIFLGNEIKKNGFRDAATMRKKAKEILSSLELDIDPDIPVNQLSVGMSQMVEIAKAISKNAEILILDEPTASLSETETEHLFKVMRKLKENHVSMIYISHRMQEILKIADRITILRDGTRVLTDQVKNTDMNKIISNLIGQSSLTPKFEWVEREYDRDGQDLLRLEHVKINEKINDISFSLKKGEILGLAGLMGSGRTEIVETIFGLRKKAGGKIILEGKEINSRNPNDAIRSGFALIPEDRRKLGLILEHSVKDNAVLPMMHDLTFGKKGFLIDKKKARDLAEKDVSQLNIKTDGINKIIKYLSGGNQQKVVIAKWLNLNPKVIMLDEPTAGVDIGSKSEIINIIRAFADQGNSVIFISSELAELLAVCDKIITLFDGRITGEVKRSEIKTEEDLQYAIQTN